MAEVKPIYINEERTGIVRPVDKDGIPGPIDLTKPVEYEVSDDEVVELRGSLTEPLRFYCTFKKADTPVTLICWCYNLAGQKIRCAKTYIALKPEIPPPPPPPLFIAVGGTLEIE